jgi:hypothetical protein
MKTGIRVKVNIISGETTNHPRKICLEQKRRRHEAPFSSSTLLLLLLTAIELSLGGSSPYTSTDKTNKNKYT